MSKAEQLAHQLWTYERESKDSLVAGRRRKEVWGDLVNEIRKLAAGSK